MSSIKKPGMGSQIPSPPTPAATEQQTAQTGQVRTPPKLSGPPTPADEKIQKWFFAKGQNTATINGEIRKGLDNLLQTYFSTKGTGAMDLQAHEMMVRSGALAGLDPTRKKRLSRWLQKKAAMIAKEFGIPEEEASEFVAMLALSFGADKTLLYSE
jgi:hypothetical protein